MIRQRRTFTPEFKLQLVKLYENGKSRAHITREKMNWLDCVKKTNVY